jgi:HlyD family secretion protein
MEHAGVESYRQHLQQLDIEIEELCVTAPMDGRVLQVNILPGEYVSSNATNAPILFGRANVLQVRVSRLHQDVPMRQPVGVFVLRLSDHLESPGES